MLSSRPISFNGDVDVQQSILNAKTPGRKGLKGRTALQENTLHNGAKTVLSKKNVLQTPFRPGTAHGKKPLVSISVTRPLMDKTPFPNRVAAAGFGGAGPAGKTPGGMKLSKLALLVSEPQPPESQSQSLSPDVAPLLRPSSARKSLRGRLSGTNFKTPLTKGNYWDVSPGDLEGIGGVAEDAKQEADMEVAVDEGEEEDDEIEYMPPTAVELPYEPPFELPDYKAMGRALFALGHGGLVDDAADVYYAMDIEQQVDMKQLVADAGFTSDLRDASGLELPELEDDSPFARKPMPKASSGPVPPPTAQTTGTGTGNSRPQASKSASSILLTRTSSTRASSRTQPAAAPSRPATTTPPNQTRPRSATASSSSSSSRLPQPTIVVAPGQTRTSALRAAKAAAAANANAKASASAGAGVPAPKANGPPAAIRRPVASTVSSAAGSKTQAQAPLAKVQAQARAPGQTRPIVRSVTSGAISANANAHGKVNAMGTGTGTGGSAGTGTGTGLRARSATVNVNTSAPGRGRLPAGGAPASGVKGTQGARGGKADRDGDARDGDELATALEKAIGDGGPEDFVFDV